MSYIQFLWRSIISNRINIIIFLLIPLFSLGLLFVNISNQKSSNLYYFAENRIQYNKSLLKSKDAQPASISRYLIKINTNVTNAIAKHDWLAAYHFQKIVNNNDLHTADTPDWIMKINQRNNLLMDYLSEHRINDPESEEYPTHSLTFTMWINNILMPFMITFVMIFVLSRLFNHKFYESINKNQLIPIAANQQSILEIAFGTSGFYIYYLLLNLFNLIMSSLIVGTIRLDYPFFVNSNGSMKYVPIATIFGQTLMLQLLLMIFITSTVYLVSLICKKLISTVITSSAILIMLSVATHIFGFLRDIAQFLPTTYLDSVGIISGNSLYLSSSIDFTDAIIVLPISILVILGLIVILNQHQHSKEAA
ncbi:hypothetical protein MOO44_03885 [Nicoliella spurrieriana]|uniref:ABC transporter permease n=1 Tax=Nicoliella spurrieriana TaxID=2925830 RepID=A0A976RSZ1_9LACO|nr:hypothetical protein [Nicoliella spurrieriana]UQS87307.1 hypothetical protein MOO44_03885 [Nicoliella spurrieriana]